MADALRGSMDAAEYKHFVLGLIFLKYTSDAFDDRKTQIEAELEADGIPENGRAALLENRDEYTGRGVFWVPPAAEMRGVMFSSIICEADITCKRAFDKLWSAL